MNNIKNILIVLFLTLKLSLEDFKFTILHTGDLHAHFGTESNEECCTISQVIQYISAERNKTKPLIYVDAGDLFTGSVLFTIHREKIATDFVKLLKPDILCLGNHEFDEKLNGLLYYAKTAGIELLCANCDISREPDLLPYIKSSKILDIEGHKIGVVGCVTTKDGKVTKVGKVLLTNIKEAVTQEVRKLTRKGIKIIMIVSHIGFNLDKEIAAEIDYIDLVIGGHSHTLLYNGKPPKDAHKVEGPYPVEVRNRKGNVVPISHTYKHAMYVGKLTVTFNDNGELKAFSGQPVHMSSSMTKSPEALELLSKYSQKLKEMEKNILCKSRVFLNGTCIYGECNSGNLLTDSLIHHNVKKYNSLKHWTDASIAIINSGSFRSNVKPNDPNGTITEADILTIVPYNNEIVKVDLPGDALRQLLEFSVNSSSRIRHSKSLQFSGIHVIFNLDRKDGNKVEKVSLRCADCSVPTYGKLDSTKTYKVITTAYLSEPGSNYFMVIGRKSESLGLREWDALTEYVKDLEIIQPQCERRIVIKGGSNCDTLKISKICFLVQLIYFYIIV